MERSTWCRVTGAAGVLWAIVVLVAFFFVFGDTPAIDAPVADLREYFADDAQIHLANWLIALAFAGLFLPFASGLRSLLGPADAADAGVWSRTSFAGAVTAVAVGGAGAAFWGAAALGPVEELSDSTLRALVNLDAVLYAATLPWALAVFVGAASWVILRSGVLWTWLAPLGFLTALVLVVGSLWPIDGDPEGFLGILGFIGLNLTLLWGLLTGIAMIRNRSVTASAVERGVAT